jgi:hypothetical protein
VIGIQVFQHGTRDQAHAHVRAAFARVSPGGLIAIRVNAAGSQIRHRHEIVETSADHGRTVHYLEGPKAGLDIHFFSQPELEALVGPGFGPVLPIRLVTHDYDSPGSGAWSQWEAIWAFRG